MDTYFAVFNDLRLYDTTLAV